jgi:hypothetical protein
MHVIRIAVLTQTIPARVTGKTDFTLLQVAPFDENVCAASAPEALPTSRALPTPTADAPTAPVAPAAQTGSEGAPSSSPGEAPSSSPATTLAAAAAALAFTSLALF